jgi:excisionase family DNA binding protein
MAEKLLTPADLAELLSVSLATVYRWNSDGNGPPRLKLGKHVRYRTGDVEKWLTTHGESEPLDAQ